MITIIVSDAVLGHLNQALHDYLQRERRKAKTNGEDLRELGELSSAVGQLHGTRRHWGTELATSVRASDAPDSDELLTYREVAVVLKVSTKTVGRMVARGELLAVRVGSAPRVRRGDLPMSGVVA